MGGNAESQAFAVGRGASPRALAGVRPLAEAEQAPEGPPPGGRRPCSPTQPSDTPCSGLGKPSSGGYWPQASLPSDW